MLETVASIIGIVPFLNAFALIIQKSGYSPLWALLAFVPFVNFLALLYFALSEWPIERELQQLTYRPKSPCDAKTESSWDLKRLAKRVAMVEQLAASEGPSEATKEMLDTTGSNATEYFNQTLISLEQFVDRATDDDEKAFAKNRLRTAIDCKSRILSG